jgi:hypothetical protein
MIRAARRALFLGGAHRPSTSTGASCPPQPSVLLGTSFMRGELRVSPTRASHRGTLARRALGCIQRLL